MLNFRFSLFAGLCAIALGALAPLDAQAQRSGYSTDQRGYNKNRQRNYQNNYRKKRRANIAGEFDYYAMVLSWSPSYCLSVGNKRRDPQCDRRGKRFSFVMHGLWPQYERGWPQYCRTRQRPYVENATIRAMLDIMPSKRLIIQQYKKHGTCSGFGPKGYFELARRLYAKIKIPSRYLDTKTALFVTPDQLTTDFVKANPDLKPSNFAISCRRGNQRLREIRICFGRDGKLRDCGGNENRRKLCSARKIFMPPVRVSR